MVRSTSRMMKTVAVSAPALLALTACNGGGEEDTASGEVITVGIAGEVFYSYLDDKGEPAGPLLR